MADPERGHLRAPVPFEPSASQLDRMPLFRANRVPRYLFRLHSSTTVGTTTSTSVTPPSANSADSDHYRDIFSLRQDKAANLLNHHLRWWSAHEETCNLMSWSSSLLFVLQYGLYRHRNPRDRSEFADIHLLIIDTRQFPPRTFVKDVEIIPVFAPFNNEGWNSRRTLSHFQNLRQSDYYFGEYLSQGDLDLTGKAAQASFQTLIDLRLFDLVPQLQDQENWTSWANAVLRFRETFHGTTDVQQTSRAEVRSAITIAEGAFGGPWAIPVAAMLLALQPRPSSDSAIVRGFEAMFTEAEFRTASLSEMYVDDERLPELAQFRRLIRDIDRHLSPVDALVNSFEAFGIET